MENAIRSSTPAITDFNKFQPFPPSLLALIKKRNYCRRQWSKFRWDRDRLLLAKYNDIIRTQILQYRNKKWNDMLGSLSKAAKPFWNINKILKKKSASIPALKKDGDFLTVNTEKAEAFALEFSNNHKVSCTLGSTAFDEQVKSHVDRFNFDGVNTTENELVTADEITSIIKRLHTRKAAGFDGIKNCFLKKLPPCGVSYLTDVINYCLIFQYFPSSWKKAKVIPIQKPGKPINEISSYRPISLLSSLSKILEKVIKDKVWYFANENKIIPDQQFGFRPSHSTTQQIYRLHKHIRENFEQQKSTALVLLDIEKAFDSVWHDGLIFKLMKFNFPPFLIKIIKSFLVNRSYCVSVNNILSTSTNIPAGVPQGSVLGPLLYIIYTSDLPFHAHCHYAFYADDTGIFSSNVFSKDILRDLQNGLDNMTAFFCKWKIKINAGKTQALFFSRKRKSCYLPSMELKVNGTTAPWLSQGKYLGVVFDSKLTYLPHILHVKSKFNIAIKMLYPLINRKSALSKENKIVIAKVIFQAILLYACPAWGICAKTNLQKLQVAQNKLLKMSLNLSWLYSTKTLHLENNIELVSDVISNRTERFLNTCRYSDNKLIKGLGS